MTAQWSVLTSRSEACKTRRPWPHTLGPHTWEGLTYTVKPLAGRWPSSQKLIGRHTRRHTCKVVQKRRHDRLSLGTGTKRKWSYHTVVQSARLWLGRRLKEVACRLSVFALCLYFSSETLSVSCLARLPICGTEERPCWSFRTQTSTVIVQIGWKPTHVFNK